MVGYEGKIENYIMACLLESPDLMKRCNFSSELFFDKRLRGLFEFLRTLDDWDYSIAVMEGHTIALEVMANFVTNAHFDKFLSEFVNEASKRLLERDLIALAHRCKQKDSKYDEVIGMLDKVSVSASNSVSVKSCQDIEEQDYKQDVYDEIERELSGDKEATGYPCSIKALKEFRYKRGEFQTISALNGHAKSLMATQDAMHLANKFGLKGMIVSLEMNKKELGVRMAKTHYYQIDKSKHIDKLSQHRMAIQDLFKNISICDDNLEVHEIGTLIRKKVREEGIFFVFIDYFNIIKCNAVKEKLDRFEYISGYFRVLAKELNISITMLAQLNSAFNKFNNNKEYPTKENIKDCAKLAEDSYRVLLLYRTEEGVSTQDGMIDKYVFILDKNRNGSLQTIEYGALFRNYGRLSTFSLN